MVNGELVKKYGLDLEFLKKEQEKLRKDLDIKDNFGVGDRVGAIENILVGNQILSSIIVIDKDFETIDQAFFVDKLRFPYLFGFKGYREVPAMMAAYNQLNEKPDIVLISGEGINHERLGIASHFSISVGVPTIGVSDKLFDGNEIKGDDVLMSGEKVGAVFESKPGSRPLYICPGNNISVDGAEKLVKGLMKPPHKLPEPMHLVRKYAKSVRSEVLV